MANTIIDITANKASVGLKKAAELCWSSTDTPVSLTSGRVLYIGSTGLLETSTTSSTELAYLTGVTSNVQTQLNAKAPKDSPTFTGTVSGITATMVGLGNVTNESKTTMFNNPTFTGTVTIPEIPVNDTDAASKGYVDSFNQVYYKQYVDVVVANTASETTLFSGLGSIPANTLQVGDIICLEACGKMSTVNNSQTAQVRLMIGGTNILGSSQLTLSGTALDNDLFVNRFTIRVKSIGYFGVIQCFGYTLIHDGTGIQAPGMREMIGADITVNTTTDLSIDETYQWGAANAGNTITMSTVLIRDMG